MSKKRLLVTGHRGLVGSAICRQFSKDSSIEILTVDRSEVDLCDSQAVHDLMSRIKPTDVVLAAAKVGGIAANMAEPVAFLLENLEIQKNVMVAAVASGAESLMMLGSSCIYPRETAQPIPEDAFMTGPLEPTNESYAVAKIAGIRLARALHEEYGTRIILPMPCNVYGPGDHFDLQRAHVASALVRRFADASRRRDPEITLWGTGQARREFIHADDLADACFFLFNTWDSADIINVGTGYDITIADLAGMIADIHNFSGQINWDTTKPDGMKQKLLDVRRLNSLGWSPRIELRDGLTSLAEEYETYANVASQDDDGKQINE